MRAVLPYRAPMSYPGNPWRGRAVRAVPIRAIHLPLRVNGCWRTVRAAGVVMSVAERLGAAARERRAVRFRYLHSRSAVGPRTCHPHVLFEDAQGRVLLDAVQAAGPSESGAGSGWRTFDPAYVRDLTVLSRHFVPDPALNLDSPKYHRIIAHC